MVVNIWPGKRQTLWESPEDVSALALDLPFSSKGTPMPPSKTQSGTMSLQPQNVTPLKIADASRSTCHVFVHDLLLEAHIGVYAHEHNRTQPIRINVDLTVQEAAHSDELTNVVCYETIVNKIKSIVAKGHLNLVETLAEQVATQCLEDSRVSVARIRVEKLAAITEAASVGVEIERAK